MSSDALPLLVPVRQRLWSKRLDDVEGETERLIGQSGLARRIRPGARVAIGVGSRGVANIDRIVRAAVHEVRRLSGDPFIVPAMGSHGGATAAGQVVVLSELGVTEATVGAPILSSMDVELVGETPSGMPVHVDRNALGADAVIVINRVKKHTDITSTFESGLFKMLAIGLGKKAQAELIHAYGAAGLRRYIPEVARVVLARAPIALGLAALENGYEETAEIHAFEPDEIEEGERRLLARNKRQLPRLPFGEIDVLIVDRMGKEVSGTGMDTNVLGRIRIPGEPELRRPRVHLVVVLDLTHASHGNAIGVGLADLTTRRLVDKIDHEATYVNGITSGFFERAKIPITMATDRAAIETALARLSPEQRARPRIARIRDTLHLAEFEATPDLIAQATTPVEIIGQGRSLSFDSSGTLLPGSLPETRHAVLV